jgi:hypothetical protein
MAIDQPIPRLITVWGDAEINVAPDKVTLALGVDTWDKDLDTSTKRNDERIREVLRLLSSHQIPSADIQTSYMEVEPTYETRYDKRNNPTEKVLTGYRVQKTVVVTVKDLSKFEEVLSAVPIACTAFSSPPLSFENIATKPVPRQSAPPRKKRRRSPGRSDRRSAKPTRSKRNKPEAGIRACVMFLKTWRATQSLKVQAAFWRRASSV